MTSAHTMPNKICTCFILSHRTGACRHFIRLRNRTHALCGTGNRRRLAGHAGRSRCETATNMPGVRVLIGGCIIRRPDVSTKEQGNRRSYAEDDHQDNDVPEICASPRTFYSHADLSNLLTIDTRTQPLWGIHRSYSIPRNPMRFLGSVVNHRKPPRGKSNKTGTLPISRSPLVRYLELRIFLAKGAYC